MEIAERLVDGVAILDLSGRLILTGGEQEFRQHVDDLIARGQKHILVNFDRVTYLDSAGVGAVVWKYVTLKRQGGDLRLVNLKERAHRILAVTKLLTVLRAFDSEAEAIASFQQTD